MPRRFSYTGFVGGDLPKVLIIFHGFFLYHFLADISIKRGLIFSLTAISMLLTGYRGAFLSVVLLPASYLFLILFLRLFFDRGVLDKTSFLSVVYALILPIVLIFVLVNGFSEYRKTIGRFKIVQKALSNNVRNINTDIDGEDIDYDTSAPRHGFGLLINQELGNRWQISLNYDYQSAMTWFLEEPIDDYHKLDVRIARSFRLGNVDMLGEIVGTNLLEPVNDYLPIREWDRGIFARLAVEY
jgi:hypothetical protein